MRDWKTSHFLHRFIFFCQDPCILPWHTVPLMNQHKCPKRYSHAGHCSLVSLGQFFVAQQFCLALRDRGG